ncbi:MULTISPECIES: sensor domain-containing diguanylate cyclase [Chromobacterium]|uniref:Sensor domain-containing diguanylate cyclase n=1 Tax=Chromobacterium haemolyticum TaxID=394935 RepID=A0A1W0CR06_9NEIS|nr:MULTISPECIES: sensor domain-containing diguanylate cyclase [Chromobacterium]OQS37230.1 sensor domain-containing diguanylate cyclase [Chromobacterium haemolyticum]QOZ85100.1 diguanylate cyclase [Chromobacterium sp. Rain0013]WON85313.1 sensor domain-containing diguanylate cyclase [Chromobacterium haemolyticum]
MAILQAFQSLIDTVQGALIIALPADGQIVSANQLAAILLATPHSDLIGQPFSRFLPDPADAELLAGELRRTSMIYNRSLTLQASGGRCFEVQLSLREVELEGALMLIYSFSDRTETKVMSQLLDFERNLVERSISLMKSLRAEDKLTDDDKLTGVAGMHRLLSAAHAETGRARRYGGAVSGLILSLMNVPEPMPELDEGSAHRHLLRLASSLCLQSTRDSDLVARREDDAFIILLPNTGVSGANELARRLIKSLRQLSFVYQGEERKAAACVGLSALRGSENTPKPMLERLNEALQKAREGGPNYIVKLP